MSPWSLPELALFAAAIIGISFTVFLVFKIVFL